MNLTTEEKEAITISLNMRCNYIETGDVNLNAADAAQRLNSRDTLFKERYEVKALSLEQMKLIIMMKELIMKLYS